MKNYATNTKVEWQWGNGKGTGKIREKFVEKVTKKIKGTEVVREASESEPAYLIEQEDGDLVIKSCSELSKAN